MGPTKQKILDAINAGRAKSRDALVKATGIDPVQIGTHLSALRRAGVITYEKPGPTAISYETIRIVGGRTQAPGRRAVDACAGNPAAPAFSGGQENTHEPRKLVVDSIALLRLCGAAQQLAADLHAMFGAAVAIPPAFVEGLRALANAVDGEPVTVTAPPKAAKVARAPRKPRVERPKRKPRVETVASGEDDNADTVPAFKIVNRLGEELATFVDRDAAFKGFAASKWATALIEIATGETIKTKGLPMLRGKPGRPPKQQARSTLALANEEEE